MKIRKSLLFSLCLIGGLSFGQNVKKDVVESEGIENNITTTNDGMYNGTTSNEAKAFFDKAFEYSEKQDFKNAEKFYLKAISKDAAFVEAYDNLGRIYRRTGKLKKAIEYYLKSIKLYPNGVMAHQNLAVVYAIEKDYANAIKQYEEILRISPNDSEGYFGLANSYMMQSKFDKALENSQKALKIYESTNSVHLSDGYYLTGLIHYYSRNNQEAKKYLQLAKNHGATINPQVEKELFAENDLNDYKLSTPEDYKKYEQDVINSYNWLLKTPLGTNPEKRKKINAFLMKWMMGSPSVSIEISEKIVTYIDCNDCLMIFLGAWTKYTLETKPFNKTQANLIGTEKVIKFYLDNKNVIGKNENIEKFIKLKKKNKLEDYIKKNT